MSRYKMCVCESLPAVVCVEQAAVAGEQVFLRVEDDDVGNSGDDEEEGHLQLETHPQKHSTGDQCQYTIVNQILEKQSNKTYINIIVNIKTI